MKIMCVEKSKLPKQYADSTIAVKDDIFDYFNNSDIKWIERSVAEKDSTYKQFIPYI